MPRGRKKTVTTADIARRAGVSPGTVSKALNGRGQLAPATRERVLSAARELGFIPGRPAGEERTYLVGVLTTDSIGRFTIPLLAGAEDVLGPGQMAMLLCESRGDPIREQHYIRSLLNRRVDGIIVTGRNSDLRPSLGDQLPIPVVYTLVQSEDPEDVSVLHDDREGAATAVRHLIETGRRRVAHVTGPPRHAAVRRRLLGVEDALKAEGISLVTEPMFGEWSEAWGREAAVRLTRGEQEFDGVFCASDQIARGLVDGLRELGRRVPEEVGVVGMDNWDVMAESARPPLSTVDLNLSDLGQLAAELLVAAIDGQVLPGGPRLVSSTLVKRRSTELF
ncbi:LacI family DNA-binding transcriptional regulator [Nonomuraea sp. K274]|uniref:LacI family DNA-binding transcriptional regulator n=1 Tax=Nonomuraea cypriaca TaxID=1187855 RepID=A0A931AM04_9ACTN|nr:LacI family DNA-binding transcriptional regulator [Nonomuraea cypriaca]MBF8191417.1 LacI family DNA-binding transcriptional regulator [Nonomuraea cypriaca]